MYSVCGNEEEKIQKEYLKIFFKKYEQENITIHVMFV